jgi:mRNA interferase RelE/StbE
LSAAKSGNDRSAETPKLGRYRSSPQIDDNIIWLYIGQNGLSIVLAPEAVEDFKSLKANVRSVVRTALDVYLRQEPTKTSRSRIKRLRGIGRPQYRLRVDDVRVFYDVSNSTVEVLAIVKKSEAATWLARFGNPA